jgi:hypothetical protein
MRNFRVLENIYRFKFSDMLVSKVKQIPKQLVSVVAGNYNEQFNIFSINILCFTNAPQNGLIFEALRNLSPKMVSL